METAGAIAQPPTKEGVGPSPRTGQSGAFQVPQTGDSQFEDDSFKFSQSSPRGSYKCCKQGAVCESNHKDSHMGTQIPERRVVEIGLSASFTIPSGFARHLSRGNLCPEAGFYRCRPRKL